MTMHRTTPRTRSIPDVPLPGHYDVLTIQLNITVHPNDGAAKFVAILRDPVAQVELARDGQQLQWTKLAATVASCLSGMLDAITYLGQLPEGTPAE